MSLILIFLCKYKIIFIGLAEQEGQEILVCHILLLPQRIKGMLRIYKMFIFIYIQNLDFN